MVFTWDGEYAYYAGLFEGILPEASCSGGHDRGGDRELRALQPRAARPSAPGPFKFAEWKAGEYIRVVRNPDYWRGKEFPQIDEIVWAFIPDTNTRLNALQVGRATTGAGSSPPR